MTDDAAGKPNVPAAEPDEGEVLEWTVHKARRNLWVTAGVTALILLFGALVYYSTASQVFTALTIVILFMSLAKFYMPTKYRLSDRRIMIKTTTQTIYKEWSTFRTCYPERHGILLSPFTRPTRLENFRGVFLLYNDNAEAVTAFVKQRIKHPIESPATTQGEKQS